MRRWQVSALVAGAVLVGLVVFAPHVLLLAFAGLLVAVLLHGGGGLIASALRLPTGWGIAIFLLLLLVALSALFTFAAAGLAAQVSELVEQIPRGFQNLRERLDDYAWGARLLDWIRPSALLPSEAGAMTSTAVFSTFGALGNLIIILFIGIYVALDPNTYRRGLVALFAPSLRPRVGTAIDAGAATLKRWLGAQLIAMAVIGVLTGLGLWLVGIPLALTLGLIAALLNFIPNIGPVLAFIPPLLLAVPEGMNTVLAVLAVYLGVQALESYIVTPLLQQESVSLPPAFIIAFQLLLGFAFGLLGLALATPIAALGLTLVSMLYVRDYLEDEREQRSDRGASPGTG